MTVLQEIDATHLTVSYTRPDRGESHFGLAAGRYALVDFAASGVTDEWVVG